jgi:3-deoxy-D-manno-octulosonic-acid transferase
MMLGKPCLVKTQSLGELNLLQQFLKGLAFRHPGSRLIVTESPKSHAMFLLLALAAIRQHVIVDFDF